jgi:sterol desaturase/sphingolipid hydroxylase (fatty acid hydroxylase superfamily)
MGALLQRAAEVYAFVYFGTIIAVSLLEWAIPLRPFSDGVRLRWLSNFGISILNAFIVRALFPLLGVGWAAYCAERGWGLFNSVAGPAWLSVAVSIVWLDFLYYVQHVGMHRVPLLWRMHRTHHTDHDYDFTTGLRAHPTETLLTNVVTFAGILLAGASPLAVFLNQLLSISLSFIGHSNVRLPAALDRPLRFVLVTPDMHRVHHSVDVREGESNFSNLFPWWDHLFATYLDQPAAGHTRMAFGVRGFEARKHLSLPWMLAQPFLRPEKPASTGTPASPARSTARGGGPLPPTVPADASGPHRPA